MKYKLILLVAGMAVATPASATITMVSPSSDNPGNVLCNQGGVTGTSLDCFLGATAVTFTTLGGTTQLKAAGGQAEVERVDGLNLTNLVWFAANETFGYAEFRLFGGSGNAAFKIEDNEGEIFNFLAPITGPGRFAFLGIDGQSIAKVTVTAADGFKTFRQVRLGDDAFTAVPEPTTWAMMVLGVGFAGAAMRRRPKTTVRYAV